MSYLRSFHARLPVLAMVTNWTVKSETILNRISLRDNQLSHHPLITE